MIKLRTQLMAVLLLVSGTSTLTSDSFASEPYPLAPYLAAVMEQPTQRYDTIEVRPSDYAGFYMANGYQPLWVKGAALNTRAMQALEMLGKAEEHGIYYADYGLDVIRHIARYAPHTSEEATQVALSLEMLMSNAVVAYARDMRGNNSDRFTLTSTQPALEPTEILAQIASTPQVAPVLSALAPTTREYVQMQHLLQQYHIMADQGGWPQWITGAAIKPGMQDERIPTLVEILQKTGDLTPHYASVNGQAYAYGTTLVEAVKTFQERHGIAPDGTLGTKTQEALATSIHTRMAQIATSMLRMRAMPVDTDSRHILVNIPGYYLHGYDGGKKTLDMRVIVGSTKTRTPLFSNVVTDVVFNPTWTPPQSIINKEMLPKLRSNPSYFSRANFTVFQTKDGETRAVDPLSIDYANAGSDGARYSFRQAAGSGNALGKIKFTIPNSDSIYLHSTAKPELFAQNDRALSHGCIRLGDPKALARFVLGGEGWETAKIDSTYDSSTSRNVKVNPVPVHLVYWTSWVDEQGRARFASDVYGIDKPIMAAITPALQRTPLVELALN